MNSNADYVLVTGASGFIGAHVVDLLLKKGYRVGTVRSQKKAIKFLPSKCFIAQRYLMHLSYLSIYISICLIYLHCLVLMITFLFF